MKRIISIVLVTTAIVFLSSCRQQDEQDEQAIIHTKVMKNNALKSETNKDTDTIQTPIVVPVKSPAIILPETDPPPKDRDQWRTVNH